MSSPGLIFIVKEGSMTDGSIMLEPASGIGPYGMPVYASGTILFCGMNRGYENCGIRFDCILIGW